MARRLSIGFALLLAWLLAWRPAAAQPPLLFPPANAPRPAAAPTTAPPPASQPAPPQPAAQQPTAAELTQLADSLLRLTLPRQYENTKKWGQTDEVWSGVKVWWDGLKLKTKRRKRTVNHGLWKMYRATLVDPDRELTIRIHTLQPTSKGLAFTVVTVAKLDVFARVVRWTKGVRVFSVSADADARVRLTMRCEVSSVLDITKLPPELVLDAAVHQARLELLEFELRKLSDVRGGAAHQLGNLIREVVEDELVEQEPKLVQKINAKIEKNRDRLRLSARKYVPDALLKKDKETGESGEAGEGR